MRQPKVLRDSDLVYFFEDGTTSKIPSEITPPLKKELAEDRDHKDTPSCLYKIQPENQGKLVWLSGPPGAGKSTTGQLMSKEAEYVYLEADCTMNNLNPFVPPDVENPTIAAFQQKALKVKNYFINNIYISFSLPSPLNNFIVP